MGPSDSRALLNRLYRAALESCDPEAAVEHTVTSPDVRKALGSARRLGLFAVGKAAAGMARGVPAREDESLIVVPRGYPARAGRGRRVLFASHPEPDSSSVRAAREAVRFFRSFGPEDAILCLVSGGASSLTCLPRPGITLAQKRAAVRRLAASGASIVEVNRLRTSLSAIKGGRLGRTTRAKLVTLVLSDVPGDRPSLAGSGPTIRRSPRDVVKVVGSNRTGLEAAARQARRGGWGVDFSSRELSGDARRAGARLARTARKLPAGSGLLAGGETTVRLGAGAARGGRCLELALGAALELEGTSGISVLSAASDGVDGSSRAAGAFVDGGTIEHARRKGLDPMSALRRHATESFFERAGGLLVTGPTGTNVRDWAFALRV